MHPNTLEILKAIWIIGLLPAQSHSNSYIYVANSYLFYELPIQRHINILSSERHLSDQPHLNRFLHH